MRQAAVDTRFAPATADGASLRDLQLDGRLFTLRCSYLIYSEAFHALPVLLRHGILDRLDAVLTGTNAKDRYAYLSDTEKAGIRKILMETHPIARARGAARSGPTPASGAP